MRSVVFSPDGQKIVSGSWSTNWDGTVCLWDSKTGELLSSMRGDIPNIGVVAVSQDSSTVFYGNDDTIVIMDMLSGEILNTIKGHTDVINSLAFSIDGQKLASGCNDGTILIWDLSHFLLSE